MKKFASLLVLTQLITLSAHAFTAYHLYNKDGRDHWAIECADGTLHSYAGSSAGLQIVGPELCAEHGGLADPNDDVIIEAPTMSCRAVDAPERPRPMPRRR